MIGGIKVPASVQQMLLVGKGVHYHAKTTTLLRFGEVMCFAAHSCEGANRLNLLLLHAAVAVKLLAA